MEEYGKCKEKMENFNKDSKNLREKVKETIFREDVNEMRGT